jgi:hypothetical protein
MADNVVHESEDEVVRLKVTLRTQKCVRSFAIFGATSYWQAGLEEHQSSVKQPSALRVLLQSGQHAKLQGSADFTDPGEGTRDLR